MQARHLPSRQARGVDLHAGTHSLSRCRRSPACKQSCMWPTVPVPTRITFPLSAAKIPIACILWPAWLLLFQMAVTHWIAILMPPPSSPQVRLYDHRGIYPVLIKGTLTPCARLPPNTIIVPSSMVKVCAEGGLVDA